MENLKLIRVTREPYTRQYEINPKMTDGLSVTIYAECFPSAEAESNRHYFLQILFSVEDCADRKYFTGVTFGSEEMDKFELDQTIDVWVEQTVTNDSSFPIAIQDYLRKEEVWEEALAEMMRAEPKDAEESDSTT